MVDCKRLLKKEFSFVLTLALLKLTRRFHCRIIEITTGNWEINARKETIIGSHKNRNLLKVQSTCFIGHLWNVLHIKMVDIRRTSSLVTISFGCVELAKQGAQGAFKVFSARKVTMGVVRRQPCSHCTIPLRRYVQSPAMRHSARNSICFINTVDA